MVKQAFIVISRNFSGVRAIFHSNNLDILQFEVIEFPVSYHSVQIKEAI